MDTQTVVDLLNELLANEQRAPAHRLLESNITLSRVAMDGLGPVQAMARASREHMEWLTELILELDGAPGLRFGDPTSADLHYQELHHALPRLVREHQALIRKYELASDRLAGEPEAQEVVQRILAHHREHLSTLEQFGSRTTAGAV